MPSPNYLSMFGFGSGIPYGSAPQGQPAAPSGRPNYYGSQPAGAPVLPGSSPFNYDARFGGIPGVPSPGGTQQQAIGGNISALGPLYQLGAPLNQFTAQQAPTSLNLNLPQYQGMIGQSSGNILSKLQGQIPQDVINQLGQLGAERGVATGSPGSPNANAAWLSALGQTSLGLQNQGEQQLTQAIGRTPQGAQFNPYSFLVSPQEQQQAQYQANLLNAAPVPSSAQGAGLNAFQAGRNAGGPGFNWFPSSAPSSAPFSPYTGGQQPLGGPMAPSQGVPGTYSAPPPTYGQGYADEFFPGLDDTSGDWQTGMPLDNYQPPDFFSGFDDLFG